MLSAGWLRILLNHVPEAGYLFSNWAISVLLILIWSEFWQAAKHYIETALDYSKDIAIGNGFQGPFDHLLKLKSNIRNSFRKQAFNPANLFLYAVTDSGMNKKWGRSITEAVKAAIEGGATIVQLRFVAVDNIHSEL